MDEQSDNNYTSELNTGFNGAPSSRQVRSQYSMALMSSTRDQSDATRPRQTSRPHNSSRAHESPRKNFKQSNIFSSNTISSTFLGESGTGGDTPKIADSTTGAGYTLWSRLASAAGTLGLDVNKSWAINVTVHSGEGVSTNQRLHLNDLNELISIETPPGEESRLIRAMKAYHIEKGRGLSDLPEWLFEEHERRPVERSRLGESTSAQRLTGLRHIYDAAADPSSSHSSRSSGSSDRRVVNHEPVVSSRATNRLKALRDVKRQNIRFNNDPPVESSSNGHRRDGDGRDQYNQKGAEMSDRRPSARVGLPSRPGGKSRI